MKKLHPPKDILLIVDSLQKSGWLRTFVRNSFVEAFVHTRPFFDSVRSKMGLSKEEFMYVRHDEVLGFLENGDFDKSLIDSRKGDVVLFLDEGTPLQFLIGDSARKMIIEKIGASNVKVQLKGTPATKGKVTGMVKIIKTVSDKHKIEKGDILVTTMTTPDLVSVMRLSAGIVTDEGGILSHAAIVSRELDVPCVVGTRNATTELSDGDKVLVDADSGIVRKIE